MGHARSYPCCIVLCNAAAGPDGWCTVDKVAAKLYAACPGFNVKEHGSATLTKLMRKAGICEITKKDGLAYVRLTN